MASGKNSLRLKPHHHIRIKVENQLDLEVWKTFLTNDDIFTRKFVDFMDPEFVRVRMYSDASRNFLKGGFGAWCEDSWLQGFWDMDFMMKLQPSIEFLELFALTAALLAWIHRYQNSRITIFCDNESVCFMVNLSSSRCKHCMILIRLIVLAGLLKNVQIHCKHIRTEFNGRADALSRGQFKRFWRLSPPSTDYVRTKVPTEIWPMQKLF